MPLVAWICNVYVTALVLTLAIWAQYATPGAVMLCESWTLELADVIAALDVSVLAYSSRTTMAESNCRCMPAQPARKRLSQSSTSAAQKRAGSLLA
jgi:hypothetical protein